MARSRAQKAAATSKAEKTRKLSKNTTGRTTIKPKDQNRIFKLKPATGKGSYTDKAVEARKANDTHITDKIHEDGVRLEKLLRRGPHGPPIYDTQGFELDYGKVLKSRFPVSNRSRGSKAYMRMIEKQEAEKKGLERFMGLPENSFVGLVRDRVQDRVARDLGLPWHKIEPGHYGCWKGLGFQLDPEEFKLENISEEERTRLMDLAMGSALRK